MFLVTQGVPSDEDIEWLSYQVTDWERLRRILRVDHIPMMEMESNYENIFKITSCMLRRWKEINGSAATYAVLRDALSHPFVGRKDLADKLGSNLPNLSLVIYY